MSTQLRENEDLIFESSKNVDSIIEDEYFEDEKFHINDPEVMSKRSNAHFKKHSNNKHEEYHQSPYEMEKKQAIDAENAYSSSNIELSQRK